MDHEEVTCRGGGAGSKAGSTEIRRGEESERRTPQESATGGGKDRGRASQENARETEEA